MGPLVEGCSITGGIDGFVAMLHTDRVVGLQWRRIFACTAILPGGVRRRVVQIRFFVVAGLVCRSSGCGGRPACEGVSRLKKVKYIYLFD
jgi:hypothetical protein